VLLSCLPDLSRGDAKYFDPSPLSLRDLKLPWVDDGFRDVTPSSFSTDRISEGIAACMRR